MPGPGPVRRLASLAGSRLRALLSNTTGLPSPRSERAGRGGLPGTGPSGDPLRELTRLREQLGYDLGACLAAGGLEVVWQPQVELATGVVVGMEALARWRHALHGAVPPGVFISIAEETGLIVPLGRHVLDRAIRQLASWQRAHPRRTSPRIAVNLSACQLREDTTLGAWVRERLRAHGVAPGLLEVEVTESTLVGEQRAIVGALLADLRAAGVRVAIDDFGTGYSCLAHIAELPFDVIKIDRAFVSCIGVEQRGTAVTRLVLELARRLDAETVAEGVETDDQREWLTELGATHAQGYLFSAPLDTPAATALLLRQPWLRADGPRQRGVAP